MKGTYLIIALLLISCTRNNSETLVEKENSTRPILIKNVDIFNGKEDSLIKNKDVLIHEGKIKRISNEESPSNEFKIIEGKGKTLIPGLIDSHIHLSGSGAVPWENIKADIEYNLQAYLYAGITSVYDLGGLAGDISEISRKVESAEIIGPNVFNTHIPITIKNSHPIPLTEIMLPWPLKLFVNMISPTINEVSEAPKIIEKYVSNDIDYVKIICDQIPPGSPEMSFEQLKALIDEAHKVGKKVFVHIGSPENAVNAIKAGADVLAHGVWRGELTEEQATIIAESQTPIIYTLSGFKNVAHIHNAQFEPSEMDKKLVSKDILDPVSLERGKDVHEQEVMNVFFEDVSKHRKYWKSNFELLYEKEAVILVGTDSNLPGTYAGATYFQELDELKNYGMSNFEILTGATYLNAKLFLENPNFGMIEEGKNADLLLLNGNPLENLELVKDPALIIKGGDLINRLK